MNTVLTLDPDNQGYDAVVISISISGGSNMALCQFRENGSVVDWIGQNQSSYSYCGGYIRGETIAAEAILINMQ